MSTLAIAVLVAGAFALSLALTGPARSLGVRLGIIDQPGRLSIHSVPTPRCGGIAMVSTFVLVNVGVITLTDILPPHARLQLVGLILAAVVFSIIGLLGDVGWIPSKIEFLLQFLPAALVLLFGVRLRLVPDPVVSVLLTLLFLVGGACAMNLLDGMDGLAAGVTAIASAFLLVLFLSKGHVTGALLAVVLLGSSLGFLYHNVHPASVFMGDVGSLFLGFTLSAMAILATPGAFDLTGFVAPILIIGVPMFDTFLTVVRRAISRRSLLPGDIIPGDRKHSYDLLRAEGFGDRATVLMMYGLSLVFGLTALALIRVNPMPAVILVLLEALVLFVVFVRRGAT